MADIFLSYAREDRQHAQLFAKELESRGWSVFWDRKIPPGKSFEDYLEERLRESRVVLVLWSPHSVQSQWVRIEASQGRDRSILVPVLIYAADIPFGYQQLQACDLTGWQGGETEELRDLVAAIEGLAPLPIKPDPARSKPPVSPLPPPQPKVEIQPRIEGRPPLPFTGASDSTSTVDDVDHLAVPQGLEEPTVPQFLETVVWKHLTAAALISLGTGRVVPDSPLVPAAFATAITYRTIVYGAFAPVAGWIVDYYGERKLTITALVLVVLLMTLSPSIEAPAAFFLFAAAGALAASGFVTALSLVSRLERRLGLAVGLVIATGPLGFLILSSIGPLANKKDFVLPAASALVVVPIVFALVERSKITTEVRPFDFSQLKWVCAFALVTVTALALFELASNLFLRSHALSLWAFPWAAVGALIYGVAVDLTGKVRTLTIVALGVATAGCGLGMASSPTASFACLAIATIAWGGIRTAIYITAIGLDGRRTTGVAIGIVVLSETLGRWAGGLLGVTLANTSGLNAVFLTAGLLCIAGLVIRLAANLEPVEQRFKRASPV